jgi:hypothetical protein cdiviTM7_00170
VKDQLITFINRWFLNSFLLWILVSIFGNVSNHSAGTFFLAGLIFSVVNSSLKTILTILSLPMIIVTFGFFTLIVNGLIVWISMILAPNISMGFWNSVIVGAAMSLLNYSLSQFFGIDKEKETL